MNTSIDVWYRNLYASVCMQETATPDGLKASHLFISLLTLSLSLLQEKEIDIGRNKKC
jgi:hypothetical protein